MMTGRRRTPATRMKQIETLLRRRIGLDASAVGRAQLECLVRRRMHALGLASTRDYAAVLERPGSEWEHLLEAVLVRETWFFRERAAFRALTDLALGRWLRQPGRTFRILSVACASGEEPYSIVMALLDAGVPPERFTVEAVDLSARALAQAQRGIFSRNSFRGPIVAFRQRYFQLTPAGYRLDTRVRDSVRFEQANVLAETFWKGRPPYDVIFCRNLLIYFDTETQRRTLARLCGLLQPDGVLFVGAAELALATAHGFALMPRPFAPACHPGPAPTPGPVNPGRVRIEANRHPPALIKSSGKVLPVSAPNAAVRAAQTAGTDGEVGTLTTARQLADAGRLADAGALCRAHLERHGPSAAAFQLLGLIHDARGHTAEAIECYRKALYLEPNHVETLQHLTLLMERTGETARARTFRRRAERLLARQPIEP